MDILEKIDQYLTEAGIEEYLTEIRFKKVIRKGKLFKKLICPQGMKVVGGKCKRMSPTEVRKRAKAARKSQRKIQASGVGKRLLRKRAKSMRKRGALIPMAKPDGGNAPSKGA